jgi:hypothetical protein
MSRLLMTTKDVGKITGKERTAAQKLIGSIKKQLCKSRAERISVEEFSRFTGLSLELVMRVMG